MKLIQLIKDSAKEVRDAIYMITLGDTYDYLTKEVSEQQKDKEISLPIKVKNLTEYRQLLKSYSDKDLDLSECDFEFEDIRNLNLENKGLNIDLRKLFVPYGGSIKYGNNILRGIGQLGDVFLDLRKTNLRGNSIIGDLDTYTTTGAYGREDVYTTYSKDTFDEEYIKSYPEFFLNDNAPEELKNKFYNPQSITEEYDTTIFDRQEDLEIRPGKRMVSYYKRQVLTFEEYLKYFEYINGKYLGNFNISKVDLIKIKSVEYYGIKMTLENLKKLSSTAKAYQEYLKAYSKISDDDCSMLLTDETLDDSIKLLEATDISYKLNKPNN